jgi:predicted dienelactone hydrolase
MMGAMKFPCRYQQQHIKKPFAQTSGQSFKQPDRRCVSNPFNPSRRWLGRCRWGLGIGLAQLAIALLPGFVMSARAAETITFSLGATIERSLSLESLEIFAEEGRITEDLQPYADLIAKQDPKALEQFRALLNQRVDVDVTTVSQFAYTPQGEFLLERAGEVFRTGARLSGQKGLRSAAILAAADQEAGLTLLNVIRYFPTPVLRVDVQGGLSLTRQASSAFRQSSLALALVEQLSFQNAGNPFPEGATAASLNQLATQPASFTVQKFSLRLKASDKPVDIYLPNAFRFEAFKRPAVVISHGVGSDRTSYAYLAQFLAGHGFAVINVEHPGSSAEQLDNLIAGLTDEAVSVVEFVNRPRLISDVLDRLEEQSLINKNLAGIDFQNVGVIGQSFGGYTALAVAGAPLNFQSLNSACPPDFSIDISLLLQCQALTLGEPGQDSLSFTDERIRAVMAINPITEAVFGPDSLAQITVPTFIVAGSADTVAPAFQEQIRPFSWLTTPERYLLLLEGATHFSTIGITGTETFVLPSSIVGPVPEVSREYMQVMSLAFLNTHLNGDARYAPILSSAFVTRFSRPEMPMSLISELSPEQLEAQLSADAAATEAFQQALNAAVEQALADPTLLPEPLPGDIPSGVPSE